MSAVSFSTASAIGITYPAPCIDAGCSKSHRLSDDRRLHENQLYIQILGVLKQMGGGVHVRKNYYPDQKTKDRLKLVYEAQKANDLVPEPDEIGGAKAYSFQLNQITDAAKNRRLAALKWQAADMEAFSMDYSISLPEIEIDSSNALELLERLHQIYLRRSYVQ